MYLYILSVRSIFAKHFLLLYSIRLDLASIRICYLCIEGFVIYSLKPSAFVPWQSYAVDSYKSVIHFFIWGGRKTRVKFEGRRFFQKINTLTSRLILGGSILFSLFSDNKIPIVQSPIARFTVGLKLPTEICFY